MQCVPPHHEKKIYIYDVQCILESNSALSRWMDPANLKRWGGIHPMRKRGARFRDVKQFYSVRAGAWPHIVNPPPAGLTPL